MKLLLTLGCLIIISSVFSQCPSGNVFLTTQEDVNAFYQDFPDCNSIQGDLNVSGSAIESLLPLLNIDSVMGDLEFTNLGFINNFQQFGDIEYVGGDLNIYNCTFLTNLTGLESLNTVEASIRISDNPSLNSLSGLGEITQIDNLRLFGNNDLSQIDALSSLESVAGYMQMTDNTFLQDLNGLSSLSSVQEDITIENNGLLSLSGLSSLHQVNGSIFIQANTALVDIGWPLQEVQGDLTIVGNNALVSLNGLNGISSINGRFEVSENDVLLSIEALDHEVTFGDSIVIVYNPILQICDHEAICLALPISNFRIESNSEGCSSIAEVETACLLDDLDELEYRHLKPYPNPASEEINIDTDTPIQFELFDITGQLIQRGITSRSISIDAHPSGLYILSLSNGQSIYTLSIR